MDTRSGHTDSSAGGIDGSVRPRALAALFFIGLALVYLSLSPFAFRMMGYMEEEVSTARQVLAKLHLISDASASEQMSYTRNGAAPLLVHAPLLLASHWLFGESRKAEDTILALQPVLLTAAALTIVFVWGSRLARSRGWGFLLAMAGAFTTMLWPYAYIGLETQQTLFLLVAAWVALEKRDRPGMGWLLLFVVSAAMAVSVKSTGAFLVPAVGWLAFVYARRSSAPVLRLGLSALAVVAAVLLAAYSRSFFWETQGGTAAYLRFWLVSDGLSYALNNVAFLASPNKGLLVFSPLLILSVAAFPRLLRRREPVAVLTLLVLGGLMGGYSLLTCWADENWGPRYLHSAVPPLLLCIAASCRGRSLRWRRSGVLALLVVMGFIVSALGGLFWYGSLHQLATVTQQNGLEWLHGDITWNHIKFNGRLFLVWLKPADALDTAWTPAQIWYFSPPDPPPARPTVDLKRTLDLVGRPISVPQALFFQRIHAGPASGSRLVVPGLALSFLVGCALLSVCGVRAFRRSGAVPVASDG